MSGAPQMRRADRLMSDERARAPLLHFLATEPYVTTRTHEARALLALGDHDWSASAPGRVARIERAPTIPLISPGGPSATTDPAAISTTRSAKSSASSR